MSYKLDLLKSFSKIRETPAKRLQLNIKNQIRAYGWTFKKDPLKLEKILWAIHKIVRFFDICGNLGNAKFSSFLSFTDWRNATILVYNYIWYNILWCTDRSSEKVLYRTWWKLSSLIENYIMEKVRLPSSEI